VLFSMTQFYLFIVLSVSKQKVLKKAYCCFSIGQISPFYGVKQLNKTENAFSPLTARTARLLIQT
jgi:hypothetical protein